MTARLPEPWYLPTPSFGINRALGGVGLASGRFHVYWGVKASGKTTAALQQIAVAQRQGKTCAYIDAERALDTPWAIKNGVDVDSLLYMRKNAVEPILSELLPMIRDEKIDLLVVDSLNSMNYESFYEKPESNAMGSAARSSKFFTSKVLEALGFNQHVIFVSHASMDLSGQRPMLKAAVGSAIDHWASTIIKFQKSYATDDQRPDGSFKVNWRIDKSKQSVYPVKGSYFFNPFTAEIDRVQEIVTYAVEEGVIDKSGAWFYYPNRDEKQYQWHGEAAIVKNLQADEALYNVISNELNAKGVVASDDDD
jgi:recombination protein RecA